MTHWRTPALSILALLLALLAAGRPAPAGVVAKGTPRQADALLAEGFESESWRLGWTVLDADGSGDSWGRLSVDQYYEPRGGDWSLGCRFHEDGSANDDWLISPPLRADNLRRAFTIYYRSQDPAWPETVEFLLLWAAAPLPATELDGRREDFQLLLRVAEASVEWQAFRHEVDPDVGGVWYMAVRNVSQDRFVLLVDDASGLLTVPTSPWALEEEFTRLDFGLLPQDSSRQGTLRLWNMHEDSLLEVSVSHRPGAPFKMSTEWVQDTVLICQPEDTLGAVAGFFPFYVLDADTTRHLGFFQDSLVLDLFHRAGDLARLVIPLTGASWRPDAPDSLLLLEDFEAETPSGWSRWVDAAATDTAGWQYGSFVSSANFTVPARTRFAHLNSDARGRFTADGRPLTQDAWLATPWLDVSHTAEGGEARGLLLAWDQVYDHRAGGRLEVWADSAGAGWRRVGAPAPSREWDSRDLDLSALAGGDSLRLAFRFTGSWSYGAAVDNVVLLPLSDALPGASAPAPDPPLPAAQVLLAPNPFNPITQVRYQATAAGRLEVTVYNLLGQRVMERGPVLLRPGPNSLTLDFSSLASGCYLVRLVATGAEGRAEQHLRRVTYVK